MKRANPDSRVGTIVKVVNEESLPNTGTKSEYLIFGAAATSILLGLGLVKRSEDEEATN